jgi:hypothetical protein
MNVETLEHPVEPQSAIMEGNCRPAGSLLARRGPASFDLSSLQPRAVDKWQLVATATRCWQGGRIGPPAVPGRLDFPEV